MGGPAPLGVLTWKKGGDQASNVGEVESVGG